ncbi:MAG: hypothetical protein ACRDLV_15770 [Solirubrobacteraceae bacterium]
MRDAIAQERVGEQTHAVDLDQDGGVPQKNDAICRVRAIVETRAIGHR